MHISHIYLAIRKNFGDHHYVHIFENCRLTRNTLASTVCKRNMFPYFYSHQFHSVISTEKENFVSSIRVKRGLRVFYPQNLGQDAQKMKAVHQRTHIISFTTHKFTLPCVKLTR